MIRQILFCIFLALPTYALCGSQNDQDRARNAVSRGAVLPLSTILSAVRNSVPGRVLDAKLTGNERSGNMRYRLKILTPDGRMVRLTVDATNAAILKSN